MPMIGPLFHPRRYPPSQVPRPPRFERLVLAPFGRVAEWLCAPFMHWDPATLIISKTDVVIAGLPTPFAGYVISLVTDLHHSRIVPRWWLEEIAERSNAQHPDLVVLGGDFVSHAKREVAGLEDILRRFAARDGVVAVLGNHDHWVGAELVSRAIERAGVDLLLNRHRLIRRGDAQLCIAGVDDFTHGAIRLDAAFTGVPGHVPRVLVSHNPDLIEYLPPGLRVDLILSGHTHNGHAHFPLIGPLTAPSQFGGRYLHGLARWRETQIYVSAGVGAPASPFRWGNPPEIAIIRLRRAA